MGDSAGVVTEGLRLSRWMTRATEADLWIVQRASAVSRLRMVRAFVLFINLLGNGWVYILVGLGLIAHMGSAAVRVIAAASVAAAASHLIYTVVKRRTRRLRPFERDATIKPVSGVLDRYSFPSGHCMTVVAVAVPIVVANPAWWLTAAAGFVMVALCRLVAGHHYPSDVASGALLGLLVSAPVALLMFPAAT